MKKCIDGKIFKYEILQNPHDIAKAILLFLGQKAIKLWVGKVGDQKSATLDL